MKNGFNIKYIENNLVFNNDNECFAYYELIPFNYSFLSPDEKLVIHDKFRQLISGNKDGKIHALQIACSEHIKDIQERSKESVSGRLKNIATKRIDAQTDALISMIGKSQTDYRFFIGFKLIKNEKELTIKSFADDIKEYFLEFTNEVNHSLMGDFISMSNDEIRRYLKLENLLYSKISKRFKVRRLNKNDFGYLIEHIHSGEHKDLKEYVLDLPVIRLKTASIIKKYDLISPTACLIEEKQRYLKITKDCLDRKDFDDKSLSGNKNPNKNILNDSVIYASYFTMSLVVGDLDFPYSEIFYYQAGQFDFPIDTSMNIEIVENKKALFTVRNKKKELKDLDRHAYFSGNETGINVLEALENVDELENNLDKSKEAMYKLSFIIRVWAYDKQELFRRLNEVRDFYEDFNIKLVRPFGDMTGLHFEFMPAAKRYINDYVQYVTSDFLAGLGFGAGRLLGEKDGIYIGYNIDTGANVYLKPSLAARGVKGSTTNALACAFLGSLGGGKSFANNLLVYYSVLFGGQALILDPKSERGNWDKMLPEIKNEINIVTLSSKTTAKGLLDPYVIMKKSKDSESLAIDILSFLTGISSRDSDKFPVLRKAVRNVTKKEKRGLLLVIDELRKENTPVANAVAQHIESFTDYDFASLLFSDGNVKESISLDKKLNIIQVADLVLPDTNTNASEYVATEILSIAMLITISTFALDFIRTDRSIFKIVDLDEAWSFLQVQQGKTLSNKLIRAGRSMNAGVYFVTQNSSDLSDEKMKNNIGLKFAFRSTDINEIKNTLKFFGVDSEDETNQKRLRELENGQCLMQDLYGRVGVVQIQPLFSDLFNAFDTRPPVNTDKKSAKRKRENKAYDI